MNYSHGTKERVHGNDIIVLWVLCKNREPLWTRKQILFISSPEGVVVIGYEFVLAKKMPYKYSLVDAVVAVILVAVERDKHSDTCTRLPSLLCHRWRC